VPLQHLLRLARTGWSVEQGALEPFCSPLLCTSFTLTHPPRAFPPPRAPRQAFCSKMTMQTKPFAWLSGEIISGELGHPLLLQAGLHNHLLRVPNLLFSLVWVALPGVSGQLGSGWRPPRTPACARAIAAGSGGHRCISPVAGAPPAPILRPLRFPDATFVRIRTGCRRDRYPRLC
jgi:hypothetical protein